jgi:hypothetical protein
VKKKGIKGDMARRGENAVKGEHSKGKRKKKNRTVAVQIVT